MTEDAFRLLALSFPEAVESSHMGHPDFRVGGKIFATLGSPKPGWGMVKLDLDQREMFVAADPKAFTPVPGGWGKRGATLVQLRFAKKNITRDALLAAWRNTAPRRLTMSDTQKENR